MDWRGKQIPTRPGFSRLQRVCFLIYFFPVYGLVNVLFLIFDYSQQDIDFF